MATNSTACLKSELDLFTSVPYQLSIDDSSFLEIHPVASLNDKSPIEFLCSGAGDTYLDVAHTLLHLQVQITKQDGKALAATEHCGPINYLANTIFSECSVFLNDKQISSQVNYAYRSFIESLIFYSKSSQDTMLSAALFVKDKAGYHDEMKHPFNNTGFKTRKDRFQSGGVVDLLAPLHFDLGTQPKLLISGVSLRIKLEKNKDSFSLLSETDGFKCHIKMAKLYIRKVNVAPSIALAHEKALEKGLAKIPIRRTEVKTFTLSSGIASTTISNAFIGQLPTFLILGFVSNDAYNGNIAKNPFNFKNYKVNYLCVLNAGRMYPSKPYQPDYANNCYARSYMGLFTDLGRYHTSQNINIDYEEYKNGYAFYSIDMTADFASNESHSSITKNGNLAIDIKFGESLPETVNLIVYAQYRNTIEIDKSRSIFTDY